MFRHFAVLLLSVLLLKFCHGQKGDDIYVCINKPGSADYELIFSDDSTGQVRETQRHMFRGFTMLFHYTSDDTTIQVSASLLTRQDTLLLQRTPFKHFARPVVLIKSKDGLIDNRDSLIYIKQKDNDHSQGLICMIDGESFIMDPGETDSYGLIKKKPKVNRALQKRLERLDPDCYNFEFLRGFKAYHRFGLSKIFGIVILTKKP